MEMEVEKESDWLKLLVTSRVQVLILVEAKATPHPLMEKIDQVFLT